MDRDPNETSPQKPGLAGRHSTRDPERNAFRTRIGTRELSTTRFGFQDFD